MKNQFTQFSLIKFYVFLQTVIFGCFTWYYVAAIIYVSCRSQEISQHAEAEARDSARQLVALQQRLATLKDSVAAAQRVAAAREAAAAAAIQRNAAETAAELQKQDVDKQINQSEQEAKVSALKIIFTSIIAHRISFLSRIFGQMWFKYKYGIVIVYKTDQYVR